MKKVVDINQYRKQKKSPKESLREKRLRLKIEWLHSEMLKQAKKKPWLIPHRGW